MAREIERFAGVDEVLDEWLALNPQPRSVAGLQVVNVSPPGWILPITERRQLARCLFCGGDGDVQGGGDRFGQVDDDPAFPRA